MYYETLCRDSLNQTYTSLATSSDSNSMPPPAMPVQSPSSVLSSTSGPSSLGPLQQSPAAPAQPSPMNYNTLNPMMANPNLAGFIAGTEPLTPESQIGTPNSQHDQVNITTEANIDLEVQKLMADEPPSVLPHVIVIYLVSCSTIDLALTIGQPLFVWQRCSRNLYIKTGHCSADARVQLFPSEIGHHSQASNSARTHQSTVSLRLLHVRVRLLTRR